MLDRLEHLQRRRSASGSSASAAPERLSYHREPSRSTVERLMRRYGWQGVGRQKSVRTTVADLTADRAPDLVDRQLRVHTPNVLVVVDFTYVKLVTGVFVYVAFVIDA
jgi:putative transposase